MHVSEEMTHTCAIGVAVSYSVQLRRTIVASRCDHISVLVDRRVWYVQH